MNLPITFTQEEVETLLMSLVTAHNDAERQLSQTVDDENQKLFQSVMNDTQALLDKLNNAPWDIK